MDPELANQAVGDPLTLVEAENERNVLKYGFMSGKPYYFIN